jgi:hypothetical protein
MNRALWKCQRVENSGKRMARFPLFSTPPWKSRKGGEIPTFPQRRRLFELGSGRSYRRRTGVPWKSGNPKAGFPLSHRTDGLRRKEGASLLQGRNSDTLTDGPALRPKPMKLNAWIKLKPFTQIA